jgi:hypothetical protein
LYFLSQKSLQADQRAPRTVAIKPEVWGVKQLDYGIGDTFVSRALEEVSFALIHFQASWMENSRMPQA